MGVPDRWTPRGPGGLPWPDPLSAVWGEALPHPDGEQVSDYFRLGTLRTAYPQLHSAGADQRGSADTCRYANRGGGDASGLALCATRTARRDDSGGSLRGRAG